MKYFKLKHPVSFPITTCWGITATKYAVVIYLGLRGFVIELPQRKLTKRPPDVRSARRFPCTCGMDDGLHEWDCAISRARR